MYINLISFLLLLVFGLIFLLKLYVLRKKYSLQANVLANRNKGRKVQLVERMVQISSATWILVWIGEIVLVQLNIVNKFQLWNNYYVSILGLIVMTVGVMFFIVAAMTMKASWRVGIDKSSKSKLITEGIYRYSRNPTFVGLYFIVIGIFLVYADAATCISMLANMYAINRLVLEEEKHLKEIFGKEYDVYIKKTPRYL
ncbi:methyltransferase family protein [Clostridium oryzae]|uniref:Isoprenylcysteine carboxyl methyltransferase (ICMT) family protein n=1 Tax=Clostridium oryzae TaxID=1450648 RepID=A0A1V4IV84_9CLOT|nr:isoprenylcysteine carboxylmethyltransferase family protein [Clostridium oryzae]OPJ63941.1 isoprenylcysteine carboxyl methyltransferase (ICMT) family protein [Clostridium oryzae]